MREATRAAAPDLHAAPEADLVGSDVDVLRVVVGALREHQAVLRQDLNEQRAALEEALEAGLLRLQGELLHRLAAARRDSAEPWGAGTRNSHSSAAPSANHIDGTRPLVESAVGGKPSNEALSEAPPSPTSTNAVPRLSQRSRTEEEEVLSRAGRFPWTPPRPLRKFVVSSSFDVLSSVAVLVNVVVMFMALEMEAYEVAVALELRTDAGHWDAAPAVFNILENVFATWFTLELFLRVWVFGWRMFRSVTAVLDGFIVAATLIDLYVLQQLGHQDGGTNLSFGRMVRLIKLIKLLRAFRASSVFSELRVLVQTIASSFMALMWSMVLLGMIMVATAMFMGQTLLAYLKEDDGASNDLRMWAFMHYGGAGRSLYTIFEATMSGCWPNYARRLVEEVSPWYALFWVSYNITVTFAVIRVMGALFLSATLRAAGDDEDMMVMRKLKDKEKYSQRLYTFFVEMDTSGDGILQKDELQAVLQDRKCLAWLHALDLEIYEVNALFDILEEGSGGVSFDEFLSSALRMKGSAKAIDNIKLVHGQHKLHAMLQDLQTKVDSLASQPETPATAAAPVQQGVIEEL